MDIPNVTTEPGEGGALSLNLDSCCLCWKPIWHILNDSLKQFIGFSLSNQVIEEARYVIKQTLYDLSQKGYLYRDYNNKWAFDTLRFALNCLGHDIRCGRIELNVYVPLLGYAFHAECLIDNDGELCSQVKSLSSEIIETLQDIFKSEIFDQAVELHKTHYIEELAGI